MRYPILLFDLDHTLLDSDASEAAAFAETVRGVGFEPTPELFAGYRSINKALWAGVERGEITPDELRVTRFEQFISRSGLSVADRGRKSARGDLPVERGPIDAESMADAFTTGLGDNGELYPGARAVLDQLAGRARLAMVTNGLSEVQRARIERLDIGRYFEAVVISAEVGTSKPGTEIFDLVFDRLGHPDRAGCLMIGDSLTSDIAGGSNYGIDTCWYNPHGTAPPASNGSTITHEIIDLARLPSLALSG